MNAIKKFMQDEEGAVAIEYGLLAALVALAIVVGAKLLGKNLCGIFRAWRDMRPWSSSTADE